MQKKKKKLKDFAPQNNSITISLSVAITFLGRFLIIRYIKNGGTKQRGSEGTLFQDAHQCHKLSTPLSSIEIYVT